MKRDEIHSGRAGDIAIAEPHVPLDIHSNRDTPRLPRDDGDLSAVQRRETSLSRARARAINCSRANQRK